MLRIFTALALILGMLGLGHASTYGREWHKNRTFTMNQLQQTDAYTCAQALSVMDAAQSLATFSIGEAAKAPEGSPGYLLLLGVSRWAHQMYLTVERDAKRACAPM